MFTQTPAKSVILVLFVGALGLYATLGGYYARELAVEIAILAILALSLDFVAGFGAMVSLCHAAIYAIAAYGFAATSVKLGFPAALAMLFGLGAATLFGLLVGAVASNTSGIFFIMATLAFGQMVYVGLFRTSWLGGDDGLAGVPRVDLSALGVDLNGSLAFAILALAVLVVAYAIAAAVLRSSFGRTLSGIHANEARMRAIGVGTRAHKAIAFAISAALAGLAGILAAQHTQYVSPGMAQWLLSGEVLIVVILGGLGTLIGPLVGAAILVLLRHELGAYTDHWHLVIGLVLIAAVFTGGRGVYGEIGHRLRRRAAVPAPGAPHA